MEQRVYRRWALGLLLGLVLVLAACAAIVYKVDPCFYYRMPTDRKPVFFSERYQTAGIVRNNPADVVLVSHQHHDHNAVETIPGNPRVIDRAGDFDLGGGAAVRAIEAYHDEQQGKLRGKTLLFCLKAEGLTVMHLGDLGHMLTTEQRLLLGSADIVMLPVGGYYTMDANMAKQVADVLYARVILPMHYKTEANASWPIAPVTDFLRLYPEKAEELPLLRVSAGDLSCQPHLVVLMPLSLGNVKA